MSPWGPSTMVNALWARACSTSSEPHGRPIRRLAAWTVFSGLVMAWRTAICPTTRAPSEPMASTDGVVL